MISVSPTVATTVSPERPAVDRKGSVTEERSMAWTWEELPSLELLELPPFAPQPVKAVRARTRDRERAPRRFKVGMVQILSYFTMISD